MADSMAVTPTPNVSQFNAYAPQIAQYQRNQRLADLLRTQAMGDIQVPNGARASWTQGAAKLLSAYLASGKQDEADQGLQQINAMQGEKLAQALKGTTPEARAAYFAGIPGPATAQLETQAGLAMVPQITQAARQAQGGLNPASQNPALQSPGFQPDDSSAPVAEAYPMNPQPQQPQPTDGGAVDPQILAGVLKGIPATKGIGDTLWDANKPTDAVLTMRQALKDQGIVPGDPQYGAAFAALVSKTTEPTGLKPGSYVPTGNGQFSQLPPSIDGTVSVPDKTNPSGFSYAPVPGGTQALQSATQAEAAGRTAGTPQTIKAVNPQTGQIEEKTQLGLPGPVSLPVGAADNQAGNKQAARERGSAISKEIDSNINNIGATQQGLQEIYKLATTNPTAFGPGTEGLAKFKAAVAPYVPFVDLSTAQTTKDVVRKVSAAIATINPSRSETELQTRLDALPSDAKTSEAVKILVPYLNDQLNVHKAFARARDNLLTKNGGDYSQLPQLYSTFQQNASPEIVRHADALAHMSPSQQAAYVKSNKIPVSDRKAIQSLYEAGAF